MNADARQPPPPEPDGPGRAALDLLYHFVAALELAPTVAVHSVDRDGVVRFWNYTCGQLFGILAAEAVGQKLTSLASHLDRETEFADTLDGVWRSGQAAVARDWHIELRDGSRRWVHSTHFPILRDGRTQQVFCMEIDITQRKRLEEQSRHLAEHDPLTGLPNRVLFLDRLHQALAAARRQHKRFALMFLDLDRFKEVNDAHGHQAGDLVLQEVARRLTGCVRSVDTVSRLGGDEFVVLLADIGGADQAAHVAATVMNALSLPIAAGEQDLSLRVSIGISMYPGDGEEVETMLKHADVAMYHAKQNGRDAFQFFSPEMNAHVIERIQIENELRRALANQEFVLAYQPEINIETGLTIGVEALIRWNHPLRGMLLPEQFITVAEECGLIVPIGEWVLRQACAQARVWRDQGYPVVVAVNLSAVQFIHEHLVQAIDEALRDAGLAPQFLDLEVTEGAIMNGSAATIATIDALRTRGVQLTIDDFGTGCSSLGHLRRFPLSKLKIDRSFVDDIARDPEYAAMIPAIIAVARSLKLRVIAEGVETAEQLRFLRQHGCDEYQGYYASAASAAPPLTPPRP